MRVVVCLLASGRLLIGSCFVEKCRCDGPIRRRGVTMTGTITILLRIALLVLSLGLGRSRGRLMTLVVT